ncbi:MAG: helix-turn-helix domain-containing protein [Lachnospiraceae bacterium]|nr:helix-turn-helix domain-containing protein [Lachnospiraceae bacterium]
MNADERKRFADTLKELRIAHEYKQADIAAAVDIQQGTYSNYECGKRMPSSVVLYRIACFYGMTVNELLKNSVSLDDTIFFDAPGITTMRENALYSDSQEEPSLPNTSKSRKLLQLFSGMRPRQQDEVLRFAEFIRSSGYSGRF